MSRRATIGMVVGIALAVILIIGFISYATAGFTQFESKQVSANLAKKPNPDNFFTKDCLTLENSNDGSGILLTVNDNGSIKVKGTASAEREYVIGSVRLNAGTYTLTALENAGLNTAYVKATIGANAYYADFTGANGRTFRIVEDDTEVRLKLCISEDAVLNATVYPVIVKGEEPGSFFR